MQSATRLTAEHLHNLYARADQQARQAGGMVDPARMHRIQSWWNTELREWASAVLGKEVTALRPLTWREWLMLDLAHEAEPDPPPPPQATERRKRERAHEQQQQRNRDAERQRQLRAWHQLRDALPVPASVAFNYSRHTYEFHVAGGHHIVVWEPVRNGKLRRDPGTALCARPSARKLRLDNARLERHQQDNGTHLQPPTCQQCLRYARNLAARTHNAGR